MESRVIRLFTDYDQGVWMAAGDPKEEKMRRKSCLRFLSGENILNSEFFGKNPVKWRAKRYY